MTVDFSALTGTILASQFANDFSDINNYISGNIDSAGIHPRAGITASQLRDRFDVFSHETVIAPYQSDASWDAGANQFTFPAAMAALRRRRIKVESGQLMYLCSVEIFSLDTNAGPAPWPRIELRKNGTLVPGAQFDLDTDNDFYTFERATPFDSPLLAFVNNDVIEYWIGSSTGAGAPTGRGIYATEYWKAVLVN